MTTEPLHDDPLLDPFARLPESALDRAVASPGFREALLRRTTVALHQRRRHRRALNAVACLAAYAAGLATAYFALRPQHAPPAGQAVHVAQAVAPPVDQPSGDNTLDELPPWELEQRSTTADEAHRPALLRLAGDRYLVDYADVQSALRCYRQLLDLVPSDEQSPIQVDDSWLLTSLKQARQSEARDANSET